ncbi:hypothetical protein JCM11491_000330 [Sporobolomyces phaffii]
MSDDDDATAAGSSTTRRSNGPDRADASSKKPRLARSKAACTSCHKAKQRCDGPPGPCHRCQTWSTECIFPSPSGPAPTPTPSQSHTQPSLSRASTPRAPTRASSPPLPSFPPLDSDVAQQLRMMNARLESLESALSRASFPQLPVPPAAAAPAPHSTQRRSQTGSDVTPLPIQHEVHHEGTNAVEAAGEAMAIEGLVGLNNSTTATPPKLDALDDRSIPDVLSRSILGVDEVAAEFDFYFDRIQVWALLLSTTLDRDPLVVRARSPLLFHAILLVTVYYRPRTPENLVLYRHISHIVDAILGPQILSPQPDTLTADFVRAIHLLLLYKPVQYDALGAKGITEPVHLESKSKMNVRASWILRLLVSRVSAFIGLPAIATSFAQAFANQHVQPIPDDVIAKQRLYLALIFHESHGALQSGKSANFVPHDACRTTRLFASLRAQPTDVRLAASVELVATVSTLLHARQEHCGLITADELARHDDEMRDWAEYWSPLLATDQSGDPLAWSVFYPYASFSRLTVSGFAFNRWKDDRRRAAAAAIGRRLDEDEDEDGERPATTSVGLTAEERENVAKAAQVAEEMMLAVSTGARGQRYGKVVPEEIWSRTTGGGGGGGDDDERATTLRPDPEVVTSLKMASDSLTCVMFSYPLIFLAKLANEGLLRSDLSVIAAGSPPLGASPMRPTDKLCRLFLFGADLLEAISPSESHPAQKQAAFLRKVWDAAVSGRRSDTSRPSSPRPGPGGATTTMTPSRFPDSILNPAPTSSSSSSASLSGATVAPQPPTFPGPTPSSIPPLPPPPPPSSSNFSLQGATPLTMTSFDFSLSTSYQPTPHQSPRLATKTPAAADAAAAALSAVAGRSSTATTTTSPAVVDPFSALLNGVSPSGHGVFDLGGGTDSFFSLDSGGLEWTTSFGGDSFEFGGLFPGGGGGPGAGSAATGGSGFSFF